MLRVLSRLLSCFYRTSRLSPERHAALKGILLGELQTSRLDGAAVPHRRLKSLMLMAGTTKGVTIRLLREIGARPSKKRGFWTLRPTEKPHH